MRILAPVLRRRGSRPGFTILEVMICVGIGSMLINVIYFFYTNFYKVGTKTQERLALNELAELKLDRCVRELQLAVEFLEFKSDSITFRRPAAKILEEGAKFQINMGARARKFERVTFRRYENKQGKIEFQRRIGFDDPEVLFTVDRLDPEIFRGWVIPSEKEGRREDTLRIYDKFKGFRSDLERIPLIRIRFKMKLGQDSIEILTKAFIPPIHAKIQQPFWNEDA